MATDESKTDERIQDAAKFLRISVTELKREIEEALIRQVANELAAESLKEWKAKRVRLSQGKLSDRFPSIEGKAEDEDVPR
jgi:hypothetical protein